MRFLPKTLSDDLVVIKLALGSHVIRMALFGSVTRSEYSQANDIDLAIFVEGLSLAETKDILLSLETQHPITARAVNGSYGPLDCNQANGNKPFHIVVLNSQKPNEKFMQYNLNQLVEVEPNKALH